MNINYSRNLVPYVAKDQFDDIAEEFLNKYCPEALHNPMEVPINRIASDRMNLNLEFVNITDDLSVFGQIFFTDGSAEIYKRDTDEIVLVKVKEGTIFIDPDVFLKRNIGCVRNTIAHECVHWFKHRPYHMMQTLYNKKMAVASKCPTEEKSGNNIKWADEDWMEWQANGIAPKILMPKEMFKIIAEDNNYLKRYLLNLHDSGIYFELAVNEISKFFNVSKQSVTIRLKELGYIT